MYNCFNKTICDPQYARRTKKINMRNEARLHPSQSTIYSNRCIIHHQYQAKNGIRQKNRRILWHTYGFRCRKLYSELALHWAKSSVWSCQTMRSFISKFWFCVSRRHLIFLLMEFDFLEAVLCITWLPQVSTRFNSYSGTLPAISHYLQSVTLVTIPGFPPNQTTKGKN